jgi:O-antigen/teichoic acid export membrane protein
MSQMRNIKIVFSSVLLSWFVAVFIRFLMPRTLGPEILGHYGTAEALAAIFGTVASWGFGSWISVHFSSQKNEREKTASAALQAQVFMSLFSVLCAVLVSMALSYPPVVLLFIAILALSAATGQVAEAASRMTEAQGSFDKVARIANRTRLVFGGLSACVLGLAFSGFLEPKTAATLVAFFLLCGECVRAVLTFRASGARLLQKPNRSLVVHVVKDSSVLFLLAATPVLFSRVPQILLSKMPSYGSVLSSGALELGILAASMTLTVPLGVLVLGVQRVLVPSFSRAKENGREAFENVFSDGAFLVLIVAGVASAGLIACGNVLVELVFGSAFLEARNVLRVTMLTVVVQYASLLLVSSAIAWRKERVAVVGALVAFPANLGAVLWFFECGTFSTGAEAVVWAALLYELLILAVVHWKMRRVFSVRAEVWKALVYAVGLAALAGVASWASMTWPLGEQILLSLGLGVFVLVTTAGLWAKKILRSVRAFR